jgi:SAM-dependent methyltransferase
MGVPSFAGCKLGSVVVKGLLSKGDNVNDKLWRLSGAWVYRFMVYVNILFMRAKLSKYGGIIKGTILDIGAGDQPYRRYFQVDKYVAVNSLKFYNPPFPAEIAESTDIWTDDSLPLPLEDRTFDGILCFQVLSVIHEPDKFFAEIARLLKPGGRLLLTTDFLYPKWAANDCFRHTDVSLRAHAKANGLVVDAVEGFGGLLTTVHCQVMRYVRDYPPRIRSPQSDVRRLFTVLKYACWLASMPAWAIIGRLIYLVERSLINDYTFTMNLLLVATKRQ